MIEKRMGHRCWCYAKLILLFHRLGLPDDKQAVLKLRWHMWAERRFYGR